MKDILKYVPGFRSNTKWKKIMAIIYYLFTLVMIAGGAELFLLFLAIPFFIFSLSGLIKARKNNKPIKAIVIVLIVSLSIISGSISNIGTTENIAKELEEPKKVETIQLDIEKEKDKDKETVVVVAKTEDVNKKEEEKSAEENDEKEEFKKESFEEVGKLKVHYLDVGQGDSIFIQLPNGEIVLIDGGPRSNGQVVLNYLREQKVEVIDYIVVTHPHEDHIGGLIEVINKYTIGKIYMPKVSHTTQVFENLLLAIQNKGNKITGAKAGDVILDKEGLSLKILAPEENYSDSNLNNHSVVIRLNYKDNSFIFTGDAENPSESKMVSKGYNLNADVLKVGHHGSNTSTTDGFLNKVEPKYAIISCGANNKYGHPNNETISKLKARDIEIFRTDIDGIIVATSDGQEIVFEKKGSTIKSGGIVSTGSNGESTGNNEGKTENSEVKPPATDNVEEVYITNTGAKYHRSSCSSVSKSKIPISLEEAKKSYEPCKRCSPPN